MSFRVSPDRIAVLLTSALLALAPDSAAQSDPAPSKEADPATTRDVETPAPETSDVSGEQPAADVDDFREYLTAEDVLKELQRKRPKSHVILPARLDGAAPGLNGGNAVKLLPEGHPIVRRTGSLRRDPNTSSYWVFVFDNPAEAARPVALASIKVLPSTTLEPMVRTVMGSEVPITFEVSGDTTVFEYENYLLIRFASRRRPDVPDMPTEAVPDAGGGETASAGDGAGQRAPDVPAEGTTVETDGNVEDVLLRLQAEEAAMVAVTPASAPRDVPGTRPAVLPEGSPIIERAGRLVPADQGWAFAFESEDPTQPQPPMKLLPNRGLEFMVLRARRDDGGLVFIMSGQVTAFEGENYLLVTHVRRRLASSNLRK